MSDIETHLMQDLMDNTPVSEEVEKEWYAIIESIKEMQSDLDKAMWNHADGNGMTTLPPSTWPNKYKHRG